MTRSLARSASLAAALVVALGLPAAPAAADPDPPVSTFAYTANMEPLGFSARPNPASGTYNSDLAFWGDIAYEGTYDGFQVVDISNPEDPQKILDYGLCNGNQGDVIAYEHLLVRAWNSPAGASSTCGGQVVPSGWEGLHIFDVSNPASPVLVGSVDLRTYCGSHTATGVPDPANDRLLVYSNPSSGSGVCSGIHVVGIPLDDPASAAYIRSEPSGRSCHDTAVILGDANLAACAGGNGFTVWSLGGERGGTLEDPEQLHSQTIPGVTIGHAATFSWDGRTLVFGHEPGGGSGARCQASSATVDKTVFFYETETFTEVGQWVLPRPQTSAENCTIHNFNVVPTDRANILVSGSYQAGIAVVDFSDPSNPIEIASADPAPLSPTQLGGDWSTHWYDGHIYESDITRGLLTWRLNDIRVGGAQTLGHLNPQTQEFTLSPVLGDVSAAVQATPSQVTVGGEITYTVTATNEGPVDTEGAFLTDGLPASLAFSAADAPGGSCTHDGSPAGGTVSCELGPLAVGETVSAVIVATATAPGFVQNEVSVSAALFDQQPANNRATAGTSVNTFAFDIDPAAVHDGDTVTVSGSSAFPTIGGPESVGGTKTGFNAQVQPAGAAAGLDLVAGKVAPIAGGLRFIWEATDMPDPAVGTPPEAARYSWTLRTSAGTVYQLEAKRTNAASVNALEDPAGHAQAAAGGQPVFRLRGNCQDAYEGLPVAECHQLARLTGALDPAGNRVTIDWPFQTKNAAGTVVAPDFAPGVALTSATFAGMSIAGSLQAVVTSDALSSHIGGWAPYYAGERVQLAVGPAGIDPATATYGPAVSLTGGSFSGSVGGLGGANDTVYARACTGVTCAFASLRVG
ncbi:MAG TPA: hypothetical protein VGB51_11000 [Actinomycetota bacterium]